MTNTATRSRDDRRPGEPRPIDAIEPVQTARVPDERRAARVSGVPQVIRDAGSALSGLPFLKHQNWWSVDCDQREYEVLEDVRRQRVRNISDACVFGLVHAARAIGADPLRPAMQNKVAIIDCFFAWKQRIAHEEEMGLEPMIRERRGDPSNAFGQATDA